MNSRRGLRYALRAALALLIGCGHHSSTTTGSGGDDRASAGNEGSVGGAPSNLHLNLGGASAVLDAGTADLGTCEGARAAKSTVACDYYALHPIGFSAASQAGSVRASRDAGSCYAAYVANSSAAPVQIRLEYQGLDLDVTKFARIPSGQGASISYAPLPNGLLPPEQVAVLFLSSAHVSSPPDVVACPAGVDVAVPLDFADAATPRPVGTGAFHIVTSAPVVAYDFYPYGGGTTAVASATLLLPTSAWATNYIAVDAYQNFEPWVAFVASEDDTRISVAPSAPIAARDGLAGVIPGQVGTHLLNRGESLRFVQTFNNGKVAELNGSLIQSNHPIGMWGGSNELCIPNDYQACDYAHQQIPPIGALGSEYVAVRYRNRYDGAEEAPPWRILGVVPGTELSYEPAIPAGAPTTLEQGQLARFLASGPFVVHSQDAAHPFYMSAHMTGCVYGAENAKVSYDQDCRGDPEFVNVVPASQYLSSYVFFSDPTYPETNLVVVRKASELGFSDVSLDCAGTLDGWQAIGNSGKYQYTRIDLVRHNFEKQRNCDNGRHSMNSLGQFGVTVWGWGSGETKGTPDAPIGSGYFYSQAVSYAYPAGAGVAQVNDVVLPVLK